MKSQKCKRLKVKSICRGFTVFIVIGGIICLLAPHFYAHNNVEITANFLGRELAPTDKIELQLKQPLQPDEGSLAVMLNQTDLSAFFVAEGNKYNYSPKVFPLPKGDNKLAVYLVNRQGEWVLLKEFALQVAAKNVAEKETSKTEIEFTPNLSLNFKGENNVGYFPVSSRPERLSYTDAAGQGNVQLSVKRNGWTVSSQFDLAGSGRKQEALRFGELGNKAPQIDLSSYLVQIEKGRFKAQMGHVSFGSQRHLINGFSSRGLSATVPIGRQNDVTFTLLNGTSIVGFDNFIGATRASHQIFATTFGREFFKERPGGLRLEFSLLRGSLLPLDGFNERSVNDAERSFGGTIRLQFKDKSERLRFEGSFTRSRFRNPADPLLEQEQTVTPIRSVSRNARFIEASFDFLRDVKIWKGQKMKLTGTYRHEEIQPLFRSVATFNQADRRQNQFEVTTNLGEINISFGNLRDRDNLNEIASILKTFSRQNNLVVSVPLNSVFTPAKPIKWLPRLGYSFTAVHQFGAFLPTSGEFTSISHVPDQKNYSNNFNAEWSLSDKLRTGFRHSRSFQDNRQTGRELADFRNITNAINFGYSGIKNVQLNFELSRESAANLEQPRTDNTFRLGTNVIWENALLKNLTFNTNFSTTVAGDRNNIVDSHNFEYDAQFAYRFEFGDKKYKKMNAQFFVRYANSYGKRIDRLFFLNDYNKRQGFNMGLNFSFF